MQKSCMSAFKYLILTAAGLKYNIQEALLPSLPERYKSWEQRAGERQPLCNVRRREWERQGAMEMQEKEETWLFSMTILLPHALSGWDRGSDKVQFALKKKTKKQKTKYTTTHDSSVFSLAASRLCSLT